MKEYILINFDEDGSVDISKVDKKEIEELLTEVLEYKGDPLSYFFTNIDNKVNSMYKKGNQSYMIIKGDLVVPKIVKAVTKLEI